MNDTTEDFEHLSGIEFLRRLMENWHLSPMGSSLDMRLVSVGDGTADFEAFPSPKFYNPQQRLHGGYAAALIDSAMGCAVQTKMPPGVGFGTITINVNYVGKIDVSNGRLLCAGKVLHFGRTMSTAEARVTDEKGKLIAHGSGTFLVYPK